MLKRLSYPLTWVEGLTGEGGGPPGSGGSLNKSADTDSAPNTGDSNQSVFSKVFSRCVKAMFDPLIEQHIDIILTSI